MEKFVLKWLHTFISDKLDREQFGGAKGHSVALYLIEIINFVLYNQDLSQPVSTMLTAVDVQIGFNKADHNKIIYILVQQMNTPNWLARIIISYLSHRKLSIRYRNQVSDTKKACHGAWARAQLLDSIYFLYYSMEQGHQQQMLVLGGK